MSIFKNFTLLVTGIVIIGGAIGAVLPAKAVIISTSSGAVGDVNISTGVFTPLISNGTPFADIALDSNGNLYGTRLGNPSELYRIDRTTGSATKVGPTSPTDPNGGFFINALGFDNNDRLYGTGRPVSPVSDPNDISNLNSFYQIDTTTGFASFVKSNPSFSSAGDLAFDPVTNKFFATSVIPTNSTLFSIDPSTGTATQLGNIGVDNVYGLAIENGTLYGYTSGGSQLTLNSSGGIISSRNVTGITGNITGAASSLVRVSTTSVPEPSSAIGTLLGFVGVSIFLKRKLKKVERLSFSSK
jgi:hypothetical protein